jgi:soluble lytic murein transglycosylase-like protein
MRSLTLLGSVGSRRGLIVLAALLAFVGFVVTLTLYSEPEITAAQAGSLTNNEVASSNGQRRAAPATDALGRAAGTPEVKQSAPAVGEAVRRDKPTAMSRAAARQRRLLNRLLAPGRFAYHEMVRRVAQRYRVEHRLVMAIIASESGGNPEAVSPAGAIGLMQLMPETAEHLGVDPWDPEQNVDGAVRYLAKQLSTFDSVDLSLVAYNAGPGFAEKYRRGHVELGAETRAFLTRVGQMLQ